MTIEPCPPETVQRVIEEIFDVPLLKSRFEKVKPLQYVRSRFNQMHDVIKFKGEHVSLLFTWGLSEICPAYHYGRGIHPLAPQREKRQHGFDLFGVSSRLQSSGFQNTHDPGQRCTAR